MEDLQETIDNELDQGWIRVLMHLSEGNPGSLTLLFELAKDDSYFELYINTLYRHGITGLRLWRFYKEIHGKNIGYMTDTIKEISRLSFEELKKFAILSFELDKEVELVNYLGLEPYTDDLDDMSEPQPENKT